MTKEERKEYLKKYYQEHKEELKQYRKEYNKKYRETHKEKIKERNKKYYQKNKKRSETYYKIHRGQIQIPEKYRNKFDDLFDIVFLKSGILIYPHNDLNNNKENIIIKKINKCGRISIGIKNFNQYKYVPEKVKYVEYKKGLLAIPVADNVEE